MILHSGVRRRKALLLAALLAARPCWRAASRRRAKTEQTGYRGTGMDAGQQPARNAKPGSTPTWFPQPQPPADARAKGVSKVYQNVRCWAISARTKFNARDDRDHGVGRAGTGLRLLP